MAFAHIKTQLDERAVNGLLRQRLCVEETKGTRIKVSGNWYNNFSSNDYLGISQAEAELSKFSEYAVGAGASPVLTGYTESHQRLKNAICQLTGFEDALLFSSGFAANHAICQTLMSHADSIILADKLSHASLIDGALNAGAKFKRFKHNDTQHLNLLLQQSASALDILVVTEGVFSMDGDKAPLADILKLSQSVEAWTLVDDAHGIGILGDRGQGAIGLLSDAERPEILMATFGKAIGTGGAFVAADKQVIEYLANFGRHYVYSTAFSPLHAELTLHNLNAVSQQQWRRDKLIENIAWFKAACARYDIPLMPSDTAIQPVLVGSPDLTMEFSERLKASGHWVAGIRTPTVPKNTDRLRITLTTLHEEQQITSLVKSLHQVFQGLPMEATA